MALRRRIHDRDLDPKRTTELLDTLADAMRDAKLLKARVVKAQDEERAPTLKMPRRRSRP
jgi:hypothetical protein